MYIYIYNTTYNYEYMALNICSAGLDATDFSTHVHWRGPPLFSIKSFQIVSRFHAMDVFRGRERFLTLEDKASSERLVSIDGIVEVEVLHLTPGRDDHKKKVGSARGTNRNLLEGCGSLVECSHYMLL